MGESYLSLLKKSGYKPNFYCSTEYWERAGYEEVYLGNQVFIMNNDNNLLLPPMPFKHSNQDCKYFAGFSNQPKNKYSKYSMNDLEFIFDPAKYSNDPELLSGKDFKLIRKNIKRFKKEVGKIDLVLSQSLCKYHEKEIYDFASEWAHNNEGDEWYDPDCMMDYLLNGNFRMLIKADDKIVAVNCYDTNFKYVNFRYCFCLDIPGLSDYARMTFFEYCKNCDSLKRHVNDGGSLGEPGLEWYKKRLQPEEINTIWSVL